MKTKEMKKVTLRVDPDDYEYLRRMAESKFDYGGLNLIIRQIISAFVKNAKILEEKHKEASVVTNVEAAE